MFGRLRSAARKVAQVVESAIVESAIGIATRAQAARQAEAAANAGSASQAAAPAARPGVTPDEAGAHATVRTTAARPLPQVFDRVTVTAMSDKKRELSFEGVVDRATLVTYLEGLAAAFRSGSVPVEHGNERIVLKPGEQFELEVEAKIKKRTNKLELQIEWEEPETEATLKIGG